MMHVVSMSKQAFPFLDISIMILKCILKLIYSLEILIAKCIIFVVCTSNTHVMDATLGCVCAENYYETTPATTTDPPGCTACPLGSTTNGGTNSDACGKCH